MGMQIARLNGQFSLKKPDSSFMDDYIMRRESAGWIKAGGMLLAYAPQAVHDALEESISCYVKAVQIFDRLEALKAPTGEEDPGIKERRREMVYAQFDLLLQVVRDADIKDQILANTIRAQLGKEPVTLALPTRPSLTSPLFPAGA